MNGKERVLRTFAHEKADRVPIDYSTNPIIHAKVREAAGVTSDEDLLKKFGVDFRNIFVPYVGKPLFPAREGRVCDPVYGWYARWVENKYGGYHDFCDFPLKDADEETIRNFPVPSPDDFDYSNVKAACDYYKDYAVICGNGGFADIINATGRVMGVEDTLVNLVTHDEATLSYISRRCDMELGILERIIEASKGGVDFLYFGDDLGTQIAPMISLELYREVIKPFHKKYADLAKSYGLPVMFHSCGSSSWVYEDLIEIGVNAVDALQPEATNMQPAYLAEKFGSRLAFHGCISTAGPLAYGTVEDLKKQVVETLEIMKPTYGYMLAPTHAIQDNTPVENVLALYEMAQTLGKY